MMKKLFITLLIVTSLLIISKQAQAFDEWTELDYTLQATTFIIMALEWQQIKCESSSIGVNDVSKDISTLGLGLIHTGVVHILPQEYRKYFQTIFILKDIDSIYQKYKLGIRINF